MHNSWIVAIDFDSTICDGGWPESSKGSLIPYAKETINRLYDEGCYIIIWTCRYTDKHVNDCIEFLKVNNICYHAINSNCPELQFKPTPKIYYDILFDDKCFLNVDWKFFYGYNNIMRYRNKKVVTDEMCQYYFNRTRQHILDVEYFYRNLLRSANIDYSSISHDMDKFNKEYINPYILIQWKYYCNQRFMNFEIPEIYKDICNKITEKHITLSDHHPEFWDDDKSNVINTENRDEISRPINATKMPTKKLIEMFADWCAVSIDRGTSVREWMDKNINKRWLLSKDQVKVLEFCFDYMKKFPKFK